MPRTHRSTLPALLGGLLMAWVSAVGAQTASCVQDLYGKVHCGAPESRCLADRQNVLWCSPAGGAVEVDLDGNAVCGVGLCTKDQRAEVFCSNTPRGGALTDSYGKVACVGGCVPASRSLCTQPTRLSPR